MNDFHRYLLQAFIDNGAVELRHLPSKQTGWFNDPDALLACARERYSFGNLFISLNRPAPRVVHNSMTGAAVRDDGIQFITRLFFDFDPIRSTGCSSTEAELQHAIKAACEARKIFRAMAWPDPLIAISGNGAHLMYRTHLANTKEVRDMFGTIYNGLRIDYDSEHIGFDRAVRNPGRICTLYGSVKRKGENTPERPHRRSSILYYPRDWSQVSRRSLDGVANFYAGRDAPQRKPVDSTQRTHTRVEGAGDYSTLDVVAWFTAHGLYEHHITGVIHAVICPWKDEHSETHRNDTIVYANEDGTWPGFHCKHSHCTERGIRDVMGVLGDADHFCNKQWGDRHV